ncbi:MAG TPA: hypothetical protein VFO85_15695 [Vicinamibacteria bacterium]|nr:hypothetical protein [Vicinamibacteria bacterium]
MKHACLALALALALSACGGNDRVALPDGTWGGDDAGVIVEGQAAHVHIGCTKGDTAAPIALDGDGEFAVRGLYNVNAYPVDQGILHPARFTGRVSGNEMTLQVQLLDTDQRLGPVTLRLGRNPDMRRCPICRSPHERVPRP